MRPFRRRLLIALILLTACAHGTTPTRAASELTIGTMEAMPSLDPAEAADVFSWEVLEHLYTGLTRQIPGTLRYELALASSHTVSADGLVHIFTIRPDAAFDNGTPITARTFADSVNRAFKGRGSGVVAPYIKSVANGGDNSLIITLTAPIPYLEQLLSLPPYFPVQPTDSFSQAPTNGIYKVTTADSRSITLTANTAWKGQAPATPTIVLRHYDSPSDLREALKAHEVDIAWRGLPPDDAENAVQVKGIHLTAVPGLQVFYLVIGQKEQPFNDPIVRQGMSLLLDRDQAVQSALGDSATPLYTLLPPELAGSSAPAFPEFDVDKATSVLQVGGYSKYKWVESEFQVSRALYGEAYLDAADRMNSTLTQQEAFRTTLSDTEPRTFQDQIERGTFRLILIGWTPVVPHPDAYLRPLLYSRGQVAAGAHYANLDIDRLLDQAATAGVAGKQADLYSQVQAIAAKDVVVVPLWQSNQVLLAWDSVGGVSIEPNFLLHYDRLTNSR